MRTMGIFDGIKRNLNIGGLKVQNFDGPTVFSFDEAAAELSFTLVTKESPAHVNSIELNLLRQRPQSGHNTTSTSDSVRKVKLTNDGAGWDVPANSEFPLNLELPLDMREAMEQSGSALASKAAGLIGALNTVQGLFNNGDRWFFEVKVDVADVVLDPGARIETQLRSIGGFTSSTRFSL